MHYGVKPTEETLPVTVPDLTGMQADAAVAALAELGLVGEYPEGEGEANVVRQAPLPGDTASEGGGVLLYTAKTKADPPAELREETEVPDVLGMSRLEAYDALREAGLAIRIDPPDQTGSAIRQKPAAGSMIPFGAEVTVDFSAVE